MILQACEDEPIRVPGSIQRHGFLLLLDEHNENIIAASENARDFLKIPLKLILGTPVETILTREVLAAVRSTARSPDQADLVTYLGSFPMQNELYSVVTHRVSGERILEFERTDRLVSPEFMNAVITNFVGKLNQLESEMDLCRAIARQVKELTEFDRVLLYSFDETGHGTVLVEENDGALPSCLGLRFPASDIPQQARELYVLNTVRIIPDATYIPSPLQGLAGRSMGPLDLSMSLLRSVSPVHVEYMRNMGTMSSMSLSIVCDGKLWGLISGHNATPRSVPYLVRSACDLLTKMVGTQLMGLKTASKLGKMVQFHAVQREILTQMAAENDYIAAMSSQLKALTEVTDATGAALIVDGKCVLAGQTPDRAAVLRLVDWMITQPDLKLFKSHHLQQEIAWASQIAGSASGLLAIRISDVRQSYLLWFRPELVQTIHWAGEPTKPQIADGGLHPRASFTAWKELLRGQSAPWTETEIESAQDFRSAVMTINLKRAEEAAELSEARFQQLTHALPNLVWTADDDGQLTYVNQRWRDQGLGNGGRWYEQDRLIAEDRDRCSALWQLAVAEESPFEAEVRFRQTINNEERWDLVRAIPFLRANGTRAGWVGTCTDLTDRRERELTIRMTEKLALTGRMTSVIAHEINNPLEAITNLLYLLKLELQDSGPARGYISMAESELQRISGITKQTLRWSRDNVRKAEYGTVGALFEDVLQLFAGKIRNREVTVLVVGGEHIRFFGVVGQLQQVMANLVSNAVDAAPVGGHISLEATEHDSTIEIIIADNGHGMTPEVLDQIFQPFYSTKGDLGNGLGLYISQEIVEKHGGRLIVHSVLNVGTTIRVRLPQRTPEPPATSGM
jgi:light-regulated signal transduction histidine kinase (bacteriophytochrome)